MKRSVQPSDTFYVGALLALVGGFLDAYTYVERGHVFANAQTGNMVLFGLRMVEMDFLGAIYYFVPIAAFAVGIIIAEWIRKNCKDHVRIHWRQYVLCGEILVLAIVAFLPKGEWDMLANVLVSFICALQVEAFRKMWGNVYATTMCTGNLRSAMECIYRRIALGEKDQGKVAMGYMGIIFIFILGAALCAGAIQLWGAYAVLACAIPLLVSVGLMRWREDENSKEQV